MEGLFFGGSVMFIILSAVIAAKAVKKGKSGKKALFSQIASSVGFIVSFFMVLASKTHAAAATVSAATAASVASGGSIGWGLIGIGITMGATAIGTGIAVASAAPAAIAANAENPKTFGKSIILVAMGEGILVFGFFMAFQMLDKISSLIALIGA